MKKKIKVAALVGAALLLVGCTAEPTVSPSPSPSPTAPVSENVQKELPLTKDIELTVEGQKEVRQGTLFKSTQGYAIYTLPQLVITAEEPNKDLLYAKVDDRYFVRIERLDPAADLSELRSNAEFELKSIGQVHELKGNEIADPFFRSAKFFLHASTSQLSKNIVVIKIDGALYRFNMHIPNGEAAEGIVPSFWASLKTIQTLTPGQETLK